MTFANENRSENARWRASAYFRIALGWQQQEDYLRAQTYYAAAVRERPEHEHALHNLAVTQIRLGRYGAAASRLQHLLGLLRRGSSGSEPELAFSARYNLILATRYAGRFEEAADRSADLLRRILSEIGELPRPPAPEQLLAAIALEMGTNPASTDEVATSEEVRREYLERLRHPTMLLVAGSLALWWEEVQHMRWPLEQTENGPGDLDANLVDWRTRPWLPQAIEQVVRGVGYSLSARTRYNLACFRSMRAQRIRDHRQRSLYLESAWSDLELALEDGQLTVWAQHDPSLAHLRTLDRFWTIMGAEQSADQRRTHD